MYDFDKRLEELVSKFDINVKIPELYDYLDMYNRYVDEFLAVCKELKGKRVGFYGLGSKTKQILELVDWTKNLNIVCFIDNDEEKRTKFMKEVCEAENFPSVPIISGEGMASCNVEAVVILTFNSRKLIKEYVKKLCPEIISYDVYESLENKGLVYKTEFFRNGVFWQSDCLSIHKYVYKYMTATKLYEKKKILEAVIYMHIRIRDFYNVDRFIRDYIFLGFDENKKYSMLLKELKLLFNEMFEISRRKKNGSILLFVVDCLTPDDYLNMPFVKSLMCNKGVVFEKAYSNASWTTTSYHAMLSGKDVIQGKIYKGESFRENGLGKIKDIINEGYELRSYGFAKTMLKAFCSPEHSKKPLFDEIYKYREPMSYFLWNFFCDYLKDDARSLSILHSLHEIHDFHNYLYKNAIEESSLDSRIAGKIIASGNPLYAQSLFTPDLEKNEDFIFLNDLVEKMLSDGVQYVDCQLEFYLKLVNLNVDTVVIMGDHGRNFFAESRITTAHYNPFFSIANKNLTPGVNNSLFSYINLFDFLYDVCTEKYDTKPFERSYVCCSEYPVYSRESLAIILKKPDPYPFHQGVSHIITDTERYSYYFDGTECYFLLSDETVNLINDKRYASRIAELKGKLGEIDTKDIYAAKKFDETRDLRIGGDDIEKKIDEELNKYVKKVAGTVRELLPLYPESYRLPVDF